MSITLRDALGNLIDRTDEFTVDAAAWEADRQIRGSELERNGLIGVAVWHIPSAYWSGYENEAITLANFETMSEELPQLFPDKVRVVDTGSFEFLVIALDEELSEEEEGWTRELVNFIGYPQWNGDATSEVEDRFKREWWYNAGVYDIRRRLDQFELGIVDDFDDERLIDITVEAIYRLKFLEELEYENVILEANKWPRVDAWEELTQELYRVIKRMQS